MGGNHKQHQLAWMLREHGFVFVRFCTSNHQLWRHPATGRLLTVAGNLRNPKILKGYMRQAIGRELPQ